ncbi:MAG: ATP-binding protein, partial [Planctomycetota bacterium]
VEEDIQVFADHSRVLQVIFNLLSNAIKYSPDGRAVTLRASANPLAAVIEVEDEGDGVPKSSRARLFSKFTRLPHNQQHAVEGSGMGLYLSKQLVELMGGNIGYHQRDDEGASGSIFWFTLPLAKGTVEPALTEATQQGDDA